MVEAPCVPQNSAVEKRDSEEEEIKAEGDAAAQELTELLNDC